MRGQQHVPFKWRGINVIMQVACMGVDHVHINLCNNRHIVRNMSGLKLNNVGLEINPHRGLTICRPSKHVQV